MIDLRALELNTGRADLLSSAVHTAGLRSGAGDHVIVNLADTDRPLPAGFVGVASRRYARFASL